MSTVTQPAFVCATKNATMPKFFGDSSHSVSKCATIAYSKQAKTPFNGIKNWNVCWCVVTSNCEPGWRLILLFIFLCFFFLFIALMFERITIEFLLRGIFLCKIDSPFFVVVFVLLLLLIHRFLSSFIRDSWRLCIYSLQFFFLRAMA